MESYSLQAVLSAVDRGFTSSMKSADDSMSSLDRNAGRAQTSILDIAKGVGVFKLIDAGVGLVKNSVGAAVKRVDTLNNSVRTFENMGFSKGETKSAMDELKKSIQGLPTPLNEAVSNMQLLAASTNDIGKSQKIYAAMNNAILGFGGSTEMVNNAMIQLSQAFSNGKIDAETWNSMINSGMGPALNALARKMGITTGELKDGMSKGTISVSKFQDALIDLNKNGGGGLKSLETIAKDSTSGIGTGIANMKTAVSRGMANVIEGINKALKNTNLKSISNMFSQIGTVLENVLSKAAASIPKVVSFIGELYNKIKPFIPLIAAIVAYISTYQAIMKVARTAIQLYTEAQTVMNAVMNANPIGLIITAIALLIAGFIYLWKTSDKFRAFWIGLWDGIKKTVSGIGVWFSNLWKGTSDGFVSAWNGTGEFFKNLWSGITNWFKSAWSGITGWFKGLWKGITDTISAVGESIKSVWSSVTGFFSDIWEAVKSKVSDVWSSITGILSSVFGKITKVFEPLITFFSGLWDSIKSVASSAWEIIKTAVMGPILLLIDLITGNFKQLKDDAVMLWNTLVTNVINIFTTFVSTIVAFQTAFVETVVNIWNIIVTKVTEIWTAFTTWITTTVTSIVNSVVQGWNNLKQGTIDAYNGTIQFAQDSWASFKQWIVDTTNAIVTGISTAWSNFKQWISDTTTAIINGVVQGWENFKQGTINAFNAIVNGAKEAWNTLTSSVQSAIDKVVEIFNALKNIDLLEIGKSIINGFIKGLTQKWEEGKKFISGIGDWIREHKGPIRKDKKLLTPAGGAIMGGLNKGLTSGFQNVKSNISGMGDMMSDALNNSYQLDIGANVAAANGALDNAFSHDVNLNNGKQAGIFNVNIGNQQFQAFVDDISSSQGQGIDVNMQF